MVKPNMYYNELKDSYLFYNIAQKTRTYVENHPGVKLLRMGIGDVSLPLCDAVIKALHEAVDDQASKSSFHGYMPECGAPFLREAIVKYYAKRGISLSAEEIFVSSGASDELGDVLDLFDRSNQVLVIEPAYPAYVDANVMAGRKIMYLVSGEENEFLPEPNEKQKQILFIFVHQIILLELFFHVVNFRHGSIMQIREVPLFFSMRHMRPLLRMKYFHIVFLNWMEQKHVP